MRLSYTGLRNLFGNTTANSSSTNLTLGDTLINIALGRIYNMWPWHFLQRSATTTTTASTQFYKLSFNYKRLINVTITVGSTIYTPEEITSRELWDRLNETSYTSNVPEFFFIYNRQIGFWPTPASSSNTITYYYEIQSRDLTVADYTTGTIVTATNASTAIVGSGTSWTSQMAGRYIRITDGNAAGSGDGEWYEIASVTDTTNLVLVNNYNGTSISAGTAAYTIGQMSLLPDGFNELPVFDATSIYFSVYQPNQLAKDQFSGLYKDGIKRLKSEHGSKTISPAVSSQNIAINNPNLTISL